MEKFCLVQFRICIRKMCCLLRLVPRCKGQRTRFRGRNFCLVDQLSTERRKCSLVWEFWNAGFSIVVSFVFEKNFLGIFVNVLVYRFCLFKDVYCDRLVQHGLSLGRDPQTRLHRIVGNAWWVTQLNLEPKHMWYDLLWCRFTMLNFDHPTLISVFSVLFIFTSPLE